MSTDLKPTSRFSLTQFCGPARDDGGDRRKLQVTQKGSGAGLDPNKPGFVNMTKAEAVTLATHLFLWAQGDLPEADEDIEISDAKRTPMDPNFSVFNSHINEAGDRARALMREATPKLLARLEEIETEQNGVMGIFNVKPELATMIFAGAVFAYVNEGRTAWSLGNRRDL